MGMNHIAITVAVIAFAAALAAVSSPIKKDLLWSKHFAENQGPSPRIFHTLSQINTSKYFVLGGKSNSEGWYVVRRIFLVYQKPLMNFRLSSEILEDAHIYDPETRRWAATPVGSGFAGRYGHTAVLVAEVP